MGASVDGRVPVPAGARRPVRVARETASPGAAFRIMAGVIVPLIGLITRFRVVHLERFPRAGAVILAPNHYSEIDPLIVGSLSWRLGRIPRFMAKASLFTVPVVGGFLTRSGQIPVDRAAASRHSAPVEAARRVAETEHLVIVYPEGTLTRDPDLWPMRGKTGIARMALEHRIPVVPIAHWGTQHVMPRYQRRISLFPRKTITFSIGEPVDLSAFEGRSLDGTVLQEATAVIMAALTALVAELREEPAPAERWNPQTHGQKEIGRYEPEG